MMLDARAFIQDYIEERIRELLEDPMNEYQDPNWVQAALLFEQAVVPCEDYRMEKLYRLAHEIVTKAESNSCRWVSQVIPGMYNERALDPKSIDINNLPEGVNMQDYTKMVESIKKWMVAFQKKEEDLKRWMGNS